MMWNFKQKYANPWTREIKDPTPPPPSTYISDFQNLINKYENGEFKEARIQFRKIGWSDLYFRDLL